MKKICLLLLLISFQTMAFRITPGGGIFYASKDSDISKSFNDKPLVDDAYGMGLDIGFETWTLFSFSLNLNLGGSVGATRVQYFYTDESNTNYNIEDLSTSLFHVYASLGLRYHLINFQSFKLFGGYGYQAGYLSFAHSLVEYEASRGNTTGFKETSDSSYTNPYYEAGLMFLWSKENGLSFEARKIEIETGELETLGNNKYETDMYLYQVKYIHQY